MASFDDIKDELVDEDFPDPTNLGEIPEQVSFEATQPGPQTFTLPMQMNWKTTDSAQGQRVRLDLKKGDGVDYRLTYKSGGKDRKLSVGLSNIAMGKMASKLDYLLAALGHDRVLRNNKDYLAAFENYAGAEFKADIILTARNSNTGERYSTRPYKNAKTGQEVKPIPRGPDGKYADSFEDQHGETLRVWPDLENFRPVT